MRSIGTSLRVLSQHLLGFVLCCRSTFLDSYCAVAAPSPVSLCAVTALSHICLSVLSQHVVLLSVLSQHLGAVAARTVWSVMNFSPSLPAGPCQMT